MNTDTKNTSDDQPSSQTTDNPPIVDDRTELDKRLEKIESIEAHTITKQQNKVQSDRSSESESETPVVQATPSDTTLVEEQEDPAIVAARNSMRSAERSKATNRSHKGKSSAAIIILGLLFVAAATAVAWLLYQQQETDSQLSATQGNLADTKQELIELQQKQKVNAAKAAQEVAPEEKPASSATQEYREIPEWGVRYKLTPENEGLTYGVFSVQSNSESLGFASLALVRKAGVNDETQQLKCDIGSAGLVQRMNEVGMKEVFPTDAQLNQVVRKKVGEYNYVYRMPQGLCSDMGTEEKAAADAVSAIIETLEVIPEN